MKPPTRCPHCGIDPRTTDDLDRHLRFWCPGLVGRRPLSPTNPSRHHALRWLKDRYGDELTSYRVEAEGLLRLADEIRAAS